MPAGDAGLERQGEHFSANMETLALEAQRHWRAIKAVERERDKLRAQLAAQQAVVDAARELGGLIDGYRWSSHSHDRAVRETNERMRQALAVLDKARAAQPEGEQA